METWQFLLALGASITATIAVITGTLKVGSWKGKVDSNQDAFKVFMDEMRADIKKIFDRLPPAAVQGASPLSLTDLGKKMSAQLNAEDWVDKIAPNLKESMADKTPYEIQQFCLEYMANEFDPTKEQTKLLQACAYESGLDVSDALRVVAVVLRDKLLK